MAQFQRSGQDTLPGGKIWIFSCQELPLRLSGKTPTQFGEQSLTTKSTCKREPFPHIPLLLFYSRNIDYIALSVKPYNQIIPKYGFFFSNHIRKVVANTVITKKYRYLSSHSERNTLKLDKNIDRIMYQQDYTALCRVQSYCSGEVQRALL